MPEPQPQTEFKIRAELKDASLDGNQIRGIASVMGNLDHGRDVIFPGAFRSALPSFLKNGFIAIGHDWYDLPIAWPVSAEEKGTDLLTVAEFHSTKQAQDARIVAKERLDNNKTVGLSVGFETDRGKGTHMFESGDKLLEFAEDNGYDLNLFEKVAIKACDGWCRAIVKIKELFEYSIVTVPMNPLAVATEAKAFDADLCANEREMEIYLRGVGLSKVAAKRFISTARVVLVKQSEASETPAPEPTEEEKKAADELLRRDAGGGEEAKPDATGEPAGVTPAEEPIPDAIITELEKRLRFTIPKGGIQSAYP